jgi:hypothetical protein
MSLSIPTADEINAMTDREYKVLENRLRRAAARQGLRLEKSRRRDPRAYDYGTYALIDGASRTLVAGDTNTGYGLDLEDVARHLFEDITIHVDYNPDHSAMTFNDAGEPILTYRTSCTTKARDTNGRPLPDGWVLHTSDGDEWIVGAWDLDGVDDAVAKAKDWLRRHDSQR